jgi:hypothetical protein
METTLVQLKWSNGTECEKSYKKDRELYISQNIEHQVAQDAMYKQSSEFMNIEEQIRPTMSYNDEGYGMTLEDSQQQNIQFSEEDMYNPMDSNMNNQIFRQRTKKREEQNEKLSSRHMIIQKSINPFVNNGNYIDHIDMEDSFLRPKDSNFESTPPTKTQTNE